MEITLNKNGFHRKLQTFVFGKNCPLYQSFCPYFWLTIFCAIITFIIPIAPVIHLFKYFFIVIVWIGEKLGNVFEKYVCEPLIFNKAMNMDKDELLLGWFQNTRDWDDYEFWRDRFFEDRKFSNRGKDWDARQKKFEIWKSNNPNWETQLVELREKRRIFFLEQEAEKERIREQLAEERLIEDKRNARKKQMRQQFFTTIVKYTKWLAFVLAAVVIGIVGYGAYHLYLYIADHFYLDKLIHFLQVFGIILVAVVTLGCIVYFIVKIFKSISCKAAACCNFNWTWLYKILRPIGKFFIGAGKVLSFLWNGIIMFKKEYCPGINWK